MTAGRYLTHITLDTGHSRRSYRTEVDDAVLTIVAQDLADAYATGTDCVIRPGYRLEARHAGAALSATVMAGAAPARTPLVTIAVVVKSRDSAKIWTLLSNLGALGSAPPPPWCAVALHPALTHHQDATEWLGDYERCLAWAWIEGSAHGD